MAQSFPVGQAPWETQGGAPGGAPQAFAVGSAPWETGGDQTPPPPAPQPGVAQGTPVSPWFQPSPSDTPAEAGMKSLGNLIPSAINTGIGIVKAPVQGLINIGEIPGAAVNLVKESGGVLPALKNFAGGVYDTLVPESARALVSVGVGAAKGDQAAVSEGLTRAQNSIETDPVGQILPWLMIGREAAYKVSPEAGAAFDSGISTVAKPVTATGEALGNLAGAAFDKTTGFFGKVGRFGTSQATGLDPSTIENIINSKPGTFAKDNMETVDRPTIAGSIKDALDARQEALTETGKGYAGIRSTPTQIPVEPTALQDLIQKTTGLGIDESGRLQTSGAASIRNPGDISALQNKILNVWQPEFDKGYLTPDEFLNLRTDLGNMAKYEGGIGKSGPLQNLADVMRGKLNTQYRPQIPGLQELDNSFAPQISELNNLRKGILDKNGDLTDTAINKIANATGKGKQIFLSRLEQILPGVTEKVQILKAIEDIQNAQGQKVGTYFRGTAGTVGVGAGIVTGNPALIASAIAEMIMASPEAAVPVLRAYGWSKDITGAVIDALKAKASAINLSAGNVPTIGSFIPKLNAS